MSLGKFMVKIAEAVFMLCNFFFFSSSVLDTWEVFFHGAKIYRHFFIISFQVNLELKL